MNIYLLQLQIIVNKKFSLFQKDEEGVCDRRPQTNKNLYKLSGATESTSQALYMYYDIEDNVVH